jgi:hypothetical protein
MPSHDDSTAIDSNGVLGGGDDIVGEGVQVEPTPKRPREGRAFCLAGACNHERANFPLLHQARSNGPQVAATTAQP